MSLYELERNGDVQELVRLVRESDNDRLRARATEILGNFPDHGDREDAVSVLVEAAQDSDETVAAKAIDSLDELGGDAIEQLIAEMAGVDLDRDGTDWVKSRAFIDALDSDAPELRMAAANGLGRLEHAEAIDTLTETLDDSDPRVRARAARACASIADPRATEPLDGLLSDPNAIVRREAADALGRIGTRQALDALLPLYEDDSERVRRIAVGGFGSFGNDRPVDYLVEALTDDSPAIRQTAVYSLIELLSNVPTERSHEIRETVVAKLSETDDGSVVVPLVEILEAGTQATQRRNTAWLLGRVTGDEERRRVIDALVTALAEDDEMLRQFAATSLAEMGDEDVEERLLDIVTDDDRETAVRTQALFALGKVGSEKSRVALDTLVEETDDDLVRERASSALSKLGGRL